jgi:A/G-specific adenine glycosylase
MAQQTQMSRVLPKFDDFVATFPTIGALAAASTADVLRAWAPLGYNMRALRLHKAAQRIASMPAWPRTTDGLQQIEGIGPFTAAIIASFAFGRPSAAIDVNVVRVLSRLAGKIDAPLPNSALQPMADELCSRRSPARWNQAMMDLGAAVCTARKPKCDVCPIARWCRARPVFAEPPLRRVVETKAPYRTQPPFAGSTRYYRGRIVQALRELPHADSLTAQQLLTCIPDRDGLDTTGLRSLLATLERDGLVHIERGRVRLP